MKLVPAGDVDPLIFRWERRSWSRLRLVPMLFLSLLIHAASFYVLQVAYTPTGSQLPPPAQVVLLALDEPENAPLARWLAVTDPALMSRPARPTVAQTVAALNFRYTPSYEAALPDFKPLDAAGANGAAISTPPRPRPAGALPTGVLPALPTLPLAAPGYSAVAKNGPTRVVFTGAVAALAPSELPAVRCPADREKKALEPTIVLVGVRGEGGAPLLYRQPPYIHEAASGDTEAEQCARDYLARLEFRAVGTPVGGAEPAPIVWGWATFYWGGETHPSESKK